MTEAEWAALLAAKQRLDAERAQLAALGGAGEAPAAPAPAPGAAAAAEALSLRDRLAREAGSAGPHLRGRLVGDLDRHHAAAVCCQKRPGRRPVYRSNWNALPAPSPPPSSPAPATDATGATGKALNRTVVDPLAGGVGVSRTDPPPP